MKNDCNWLQRKCNKLILSKAHRGVVLGKSLHNVFDGYISSDRIRIVPNCVRERHLPESVEEKFRTFRPKQKINIIYLSNFIKEKGYWEVLDIAEELRKRGLCESFSFYFAGKFYNHDDRAHFVNRINQFDKAYIKYLGIVEGKDKQHLLEIGHVFMLLTRYKKEGQPISLLEAMGNGMAVVTTYHAGIPDIVSEKSGLICQENDFDADQVISFLVSLVENPQKLKDICIFNHRYVCNGFAERNYISNMDFVFSEVCSCGDR